MRLGGMGPSSALSNTLAPRETGVPTGINVTGRGFEKIDTPLKPDPAHGKAIYTAQCASCHGGEGQGTKIRKAAMCTLRSGARTRSMWALAWRACTRRPRS